MRDFDFKIGRHYRLQGTGWRGLVALGMLLTFLTVTAMAVVESSVRSSIGSTAMWLLNTTIKELNPSSFFR